MGCGPSAPASWPVKVNVYTLGDHELNSALTSLFGSGAYHTGVEISGVEYAFRGGDGAGTGVFTHTPRQLPEGFEGAVFKESVDRGGFTPLLNAAWGGHGTLVRFLLSRGSDRRQIGVTHSTKPFVAGFKGLTAEGWARKNGFHAIAEGIKMGLR